MDYIERTAGEVKARYKCRDCRAFQRDVSYLEHLLGKQRARGRQQRAWTLRLCQALDEAHEKLAQWQPLEESSCNADEETWQPEDWEEEGDWDEDTEQPENWEEEGDWDEDTEQPEDCEDDSETLSNTNILTETTEQNQETDLYRYYKELQEAYIINQQRFASELQFERSTNEALLEELEKLRASNNEIRQRYEADNLRAWQQATHLKAELEKAVKSQMHTFQAEQNLLRLQIMEEMRCLRKSAAEEKMLLQRDVRELTSQLSLKKEREDVMHQEWQEEKDEEQQEKEEGKQYKKIKLY